MFCQQLLVSFVKRKLSLTLRPLVPSRKKTAVKWKRVFTQRTPCLAECRSSQIILAGAMLCNFLNPCHPSRDQGIYFLKASDREEKVIRSLSRRTSLEPIAGLSQGNFKKTIRIAKECKSPKTVLP